MDHLYIYIYYNMWIYSNVIGTTHEIDGWNPTHKKVMNGGWFMIALPTLIPMKYIEIP